MKRLIAVALLCVFLAGCAGEVKSEKTIFAMDTVMDLQVWGKDSQAGIGHIQMVLQELESDWSATNDSSLLTQMNLGRDASLSEEDASLLRQVRALSQRTDGAFDPYLGALSDAWGFYDDVHRVPAEDEIAAALADARLDLGGALKGYAGTRAVAELEKMDIDRAMLNLGGNIQTYGEKADGSPWQIAVTNPDGGDYIGIVSVTGTCAVVTSGDYQRYFEEDGVRYHHILDPETGYPADSGLRSVTVICRDGLTADCLSTALFVMGLENAADFWRASDDFEAVFITAEGKIYATEGAALSGCEFEVITREE